jgi:hypothetical protein
MAGPCLPKGFLSHYLEEFEDGRWIIDIQDATAARMNMGEIDDLFVQLRERPGIQLALQMEMLGLEH